MVLFGLYGEKNETFALLDQSQPIGHHGLVFSVAGSASPRFKAFFIFMCFEFFLVIVISIRAVIIVIRIRIIVLDAAAGAVQELRVVTHHEELLYIFSSEFLARRVDFHLVEVVVIER